MPVIDAKVFLKETRKAGTFPAVVLLMGEEETLVHETLTASPVISAKAFSTAGSTTNPPGGKTSRNLKG
jgi:ribosomal protein L25 (general stress protein Ctc)